MNLKFAALLIVYKQEEYLEYCIRALAGHVDSIMVLFCERPFIAYNPQARQMFSELDSSRSIIDKLKTEIADLIVVEGIWDAEEEMRNEGLNRLRAIGIDVCLIIDADEIYADGTFPLLKKHIAAVNKTASVFWARYRNCYKRLDYVIDSPKLRMPVAVHIGPDTVFIDGREPTGPKVLLPDTIFYWHFGYVLTDKRMWEKINTFSHSHEIIDDWYESKWIRWTPKTTNLSRKAPGNRWPIAKKIELSLLPKIMRTHPFYIEAKKNPIDE
jgi:hypothetical protein